MHIQIIMRAELTAAQEMALRKQGILINRMAYLVLAPHGILTTHPNYDGTDRTRHYCVDPTLPMAGTLLSLIDQDSVLPGFTGASDRWYLGFFQRESVAIGVRRYTEHDSEKAGD